MYCLENNVIKTEDIFSDKIHVGGVGSFCYTFMKKHAQNIAQVDTSTNQKDTYDTLLRKCIRTGIALRKMGIKKGDLLTFCSETNLNSCVPIIACLLIGVIPSYIDATFPLFEIVHFFKSISPRLFLVTSKYEEAIVNLTKNQEQDTKVVVFNDDFFKPIIGEEEFRPTCIDDLQETAIIHFSSGSSGFPKGIYINHYSLLSCKAFSFENLWKNNEEKVILSFDSFHWSIESLRLLCSIRDGVCRVMITKEDDINNIWLYLDKYKVNLAYLIPLHLIYMLQHDKPQHVSLENLTTIYATGSRLPVKYHEKLQNLLPNVDIFRWYGQTETGGIATFRKIDSHRKFNKTKPGCVGMPIPGFGMCLKVVDIETREPLGPNKRGELCIKSKTTMNGYHNLDSADQFDDDGWLKTGDLVYYDKDLCFFIVDRIKEMILFQGWHIVPALLEAELLTHPAVKLATVIGVPDSLDTEHALGLVVLHDNVSTVMPDEIEKYVEKRVPNKYRLRGGVRIVKEINFKTRNKVKRLKLKQLVLDKQI